MLQPLSTESWALSEFSLVADEGQSLGFGNRSRLLLHVVCHSVFEVCFGVASLLSLVSCLGPCGIGARLSSPNEG